MGSPPGQAFAFFCGDCGGGGGEGVLMNKNG